MGFSGSVDWILNGAGDGHHSRAHGAFMRPNGPQQTRPQGRAVRLIGHLNFVVGHKHHQIQPQGDSSFCVSLQRLCTCLVSLPQKWHCPNTGSCPVAQLYVWPELPSAWPVAPSAWMLTFCSFPSQGPCFSQSWGWEGKSLLCTGSALLLLQH